MRPKPLAQHVLLALVPWLYSCVGPGTQGVWLQDQHPYATDGVRERSSTHEPTPLYPVSECAGPVVVGVCHGGIITTNPNPVRCYGEVLMGRCVGPEF